MSYTLADLMIKAASEVWRHDGEVLATGIGVLPRLAASLAMKTCNQDLMMTDSEAFMVSSPVPVGLKSKEDHHSEETWMGFSRIFDNVWSGKRHAMVTPVQVDRYGQANISCIGSYDQPKVQMLGARGFPGNSISHANSFFIPDHNPKVFLDGECHMVCSIGYNRERLPRGYTFDDIDIRHIITNLCILDFKGPGHTPRLVSLHPGVSRQHVQDQTGFELHMAKDLPLTAGPSEEDLQWIQAFDPNNLRTKQLKHNPVIEH